VIARELGDQHGEGQALGNLAIAYGMLGDSHRALYFYEQRMFIASETEDRSGAAVDSWNLGKQLVQWGDLQRATELMQICVDYDLPRASTAGTRGLARPTASRCSR
jgi:hypothetical protein